jgi:hypothetical protein
VIHILTSTAARAVVGVLVVGAAAVPGTVALSGSSTPGVAAAPNGIAVATSTPIERRAAAKSLNWAGYIKPGTGFTSAAATWKVPTLKTTYPGYSSTWVGVDGASASDQYLIQTGIEADVVAGKASYYAWWELITPTVQAPEVRFTTISVKPGDSVTAKVSKTTKTTWTMTFTNNTTKKTASHTATFAGAGRSAEWIQEDTSVNGFISTAPDWQAVTFTGATVNGASPGLTASQAVDIYSAAGLLGGLLGQGPIRETSTGAPNSTKNGFTVTWLATGRRSRA